MKKFKAYESLWTYVYIKGKEEINSLIYMKETSIKASTITPKFGLNWNRELETMLMRDSKKLRPAERNCRVG